MEDIVGDTRYPRDGVCAQPASPGDAEEAAGAPHQPEARPPPPHQQADNQHLVLLEVTFKTSLKFLFAYCVFATLCALKGVRIS